MALNQADKERLDWHLLQLLAEARVSIERGANINDVGQYIRRYIDNELFVIACGDDFLMEAV